MRPLKSGWQNYYLNNIIISGGVVVNFDGNLWYLLDIREQPRKISNKTTNNPSNNNRKYVFFYKLLHNYLVKEKKTCRENKEYTSSNNRPQPDLFWWHQRLELFCFGFLFRTQSVVVRAQHNRDDGHDDEHFEDHHHCPPLTFQRYLMVVAVLLPTQVPFSSVDHF